MISSSLGFSFSTPTVHMLFEQQWKDVSPLFLSGKKYQVLLRSVQKPALYKKLCRSWRSQQSRHKSDKKGNSGRRVLCIQAVTINECCVILWNLIIYTPLEVTYLFSHSISFFDFYIWGDFRADSLKICWIGPFYLLTHPSTSALSYFVATSNSHS